MPVMTRIGRRKTTMQYKNDTHQIIYKTYMASSPYKYPNRFLAAVFLLSAEKELWRRAKAAVKKKRIHFDRIDKSGLGPYAFALLHLARDLYEGTQFISLRDVADPYLISDKTLVLIIEAIGICREGYRVLDINKQFG